MMKFIREKNMRPVENTEIIRKSSEFDHSNKITFNIFKASGGVVVSTEKIDYSNGDYDRKQRLYIITDDMNLGEELSKIITIKGLRN